MATVVIVEDHALVADTLAAVLRRRGVDATTVCCEDTEPLLDRIAEIAPRLVLLDLDLGAGRDGTALVRPLARLGIRTLVVTGTDDRLRIAAAVELGAVGYQPKAAGFDALLAATCAALDGRPVLDEPERSDLLCELYRARSARTRAFEPFERLTEREREVLEALAEGRSVRDIADDWVVSDTTIRAHVRGVLAKLGTSSQLAAVASAWRSGWLHRGDHAAAPTRR